MRQMAKAGPFGLQISADHASLSESIDRRSSLLRARGLQSVNEHLIFQTIEAQRQIVEMAGRQTRSMRRGVERQARALAATERHTIGTTDDDDESEFLDLSPLSVEEW